MSVISLELFNTNVTYLMIIVVSCAIFTFLWRRKRLYYLASKIPGANGFPLIGNVLEFVDLTKVVSRSRALMDEFGPCIKIWIGPILSVVLADPNHLQTVLNHPNCFDKSPLAYEMTFKYLIKHSLLIEDQQSWKLHRKMFNPVFGQKILNSFVSVFREEGEILIEKLKETVDKGPFDFCHYAEKCIMDITCRTIACTNLNAQTKPNAFFDAYSNFENALSKRIFRIWLHLEFIWNRSDLGKQTQENIKQILDFTNLVFVRAKQKKEGSGANRETNDEVKSSNKALISILLDAEEKQIMNRTQILHQMNLMLFAGYGTTSATLSNVLLVAAFYPAVLKNIQRELDEVFLETKRPIEVEDLNKLEYLGRVIQEVLRVYATAPFTARKNDAEIDLGNGIIIPKGTTIWIPHILVHHNKEHWPDPDRFDPDRFLPEECAKRHPYAYIPFSAGPRNCIGFKFALMLVKVLSASVLRNYVPKTKLDRHNLIHTVDVVLKLKAGWLITLEKRK